MRTRPQTIAKAARLAVARRKDGTYDVAGDHGTYRVTVVDDKPYCNCPAGRNGSVCSHKLAVRFQRQQSTQPERASA